MPILFHLKVVRACLAGLLLALCIVGVRAQSPSPSPTPAVSPTKQALIKEFLSLANSKKTIDAMLRVQAEQMEKRLPEIVWNSVLGMEEIKSLTAKQREELRLEVTAKSVRSGRRIYELLAEKVDFNKLIEDISIPLYDKYFSESELSDLIGFYKSDTGRKVMDVMPSLVADSMKMTAEIMLPRMAELITQIQQEEIQSMEKEIRATVKANPTKPAKRVSAKRSRH